MIKNIIQAKAGLEQKGYAIIPTMDKRGVCLIPPKHTSLLWRGHFESISQFIGYANNHLL